MFVSLSASFLQIAVQLVKVAKDVKHKEQLGIQVCSHDYAGSL